MVGLRAACGRQFIKTKTLFPYLELVPCGGRWRMVDVKSPAAQWRICYNIYHLG